jgi:hypothetical protein
MNTGKRAGNNLGYSRRLEILDRIPVVSLPVFDKSEIPVFQKKNWNKNRS